MGRRLLHRWTVSHQSWRLLAIGIAVFAVLVSASLRAAPVTRKKSGAGTPPPETAERQKAEQQVKSRFKSEFARAAKVDGKLSLGKKLLADVAGFKGDDAERFVLYDQAWKLIADAGETAQAWGAIDEMATVFDVDVVALKAVALKSAAKLAKDEASALALVQMYLTLMEDSTVSGNYNSAAQLGVQIIQAARKIDSVPLREQLSEHARRAQELAAAYKDCSRAEEKLQASPDDGKSNRTVGRFLCFWKNDWNAGLALLEKCDDPALVNAARQDLAKPTDPDAIVRLADDWWAISEKEKSTPRSVIQERAFDFYKAALPGVSDVQRDAVAQRALRIFGKTSFFDATEKLRGVSLGGLDANMGFAFTLEMWVATNARDGYLITKRHEENDGSISLVLAGGKPVVHGNGSFYLAAGEARQAINDADWHHLAAVKTGQEVELFIDGRPAAHISTRDQFTSKSPWVLGFFGVGNTGQLNARFCRIRMSNVARYLLPFTPDRRYGSDKFTVFMP